MVETREEITRGELAEMVSKSIREGNICSSICKSFKHTGIYPFDSLRMTTLLEKEKVKPFTKEDQLLVDTVVNLTKEELAKKENLCAQKRKREEATPKVRNCRFSTKKARVLTAAENQAVLRHAKELSGIEGLRVGEIRELMLTKLGFSIVSLYKDENPNGKAKTKKEMIAMVYKHYDNHWEQTVNQIEGEIQRNIVSAQPSAAVLPPPTPLAN